VICAGNLGSKRRRGKWNPGQEVAERRRKRRKIDSMMCTRLSATKTESNAGAAFEKNISTRGERK
jgi:hypothetical protein